MPNVIKGIDPGVKGVVRPSSFKTGAKVSFRPPSFYVLGTVTQVSEFACIGEEIAIECNLTVPDPNTNNFRSKIIEFIIGDSMLSVLGTEINTTNDLVGGIRLTRLTAFTNSDSSNSKRILGSIKLLSYSSSDAGLRLGCSSGYYISGNDGSLDIVSKTLQLKAAAPPSAPSMMPISSSNIDPNTCSATVSLNWIPPSSTDRTVDLYYLSLQNETALDNIAAPANSYSHNTTLLLDTDYAYSVSASSCAGNSTTATSYLDSIHRFSLKNNSFTISHDHKSNTFTLNWNLTDEPIPLKISYSFNYSLVYESISLPPSENISRFTYISSVRKHTEALPLEYITDITDISFGITHQCGQQESQVTKVTVSGIALRIHVIIGSSFALVLSSIIIIIALVALILSLRWVWKIVKNHYKAIAQVQISKVVSEC